jgi:hypothetical protein
LRAFVSILVCAVACAAHPVATVTVSATTPAPSASMAALPRPTGSPNPRLYAELPPLDGDGLMLADRRVGFSRDDAYLGWAISGCDPCPLAFHFESPRAPPIDIAYRWNPKDDGLLPPEQAKKLADADAAKVDHILESLGIEKASNGRTLRGPFPYPDLVFATAHTPADAKGMVTLHFGARVVGHAPIFPIHIALGPHPGWPGASMHEPTLAYANVTHDGSEIGVVAIANGDMWMEQGRVARMSTAKLVGEVYNDTAMGLYKRGRFADAAALFVSAEIANPNESLFPYNLACAYARSGDARAKEALERAIHIGGEAIKARARGDEDFAAVRDASWFRALVS